MSRRSAGCSSDAKSRRTPGVRAQAGQVGVHDRRLDRLVRGPAVRDRQPLRRPQPHRLREQPERRRYARHGLQVGDRLGRVVLERVAGGEHQPATRAPAGGSTSAWEIAPPVSLATSVTSSRPRASMKLASTSAAPNSERSAPGAQRDRVAAERQVGHDRAVAGGQLRGHPAPEVAVHRGAVGEHDRRAAPALAVLERARGQLHRPALAQRVADRHRGGNPPRSAPAVATLQR